MKSFEKSRPKAKLTFLMNSSHDVNAYLCIGSNFVDYLSMNFSSLPLCVSFVFERTIYYMHMHLNGFEKVE
jgi:hypothetical protein